MKIAILITCNDGSEFAARHPDDGEKFISLLAPIRPDWEFVPIPARDDVLPRRADAYDGYIICGSPASVHDTHGWVENLLRFIRNIHELRIPVFGCCFGHQAIAHALGGEVSPNRAGWSVGTESMRIVRQDPWLPADCDRIELYSAHEEQVTLLPPGGRILGTCPNCPVASLAIGNHVFTTQYHPEMTRPFVEDLVEEMKDELGSQIDAARAMAGRTAEGSRFATWIARFLEYGSACRHSSSGDIADPVGERYEAAMDIARLAGERANRYFSNLQDLAVESKGPGDLVSEADRDVERLIRSEIERRFPGDGVIGEELAGRPAETCFNWVIDPIDGTANFLRGISAWVVSIACIRDSKTVIGIVHDPVHGETFHCRRMHGSRLNSSPCQAAQDTTLSGGRIGIGRSGKCGKASTSALMQRLIDDELQFVLLGSGALGIAHVAAGRSLGFIEEYQNAWDCLAGLLLVEEAGGIVFEHDVGQLIAGGGRIVTSAPMVSEHIRSIAEHAFKINADQ